MEINKELELAWDFVNKSQRNIFLTGKAGTGKTTFLHRLKLNSLKRNPRLIVGTPGRINDHLKRNSLKLNNTSFVALDEADRMLDQGFAPQINQILKTIPITIAPI